MMKFDCPHCGQQMVHQEEVAGREGWCRFCKCILVMPQPGQQAVRPVLTLQDQFAQLERMFRLAAGIVDEHRQLQASLTNGKQGLAQAIESRANAERSAEALRKEMGRNKTTQANLQTECTRLADQLEQSMSEHAAYQSESEKRMAQVKLDLKTNESRDGVLLGRVLAIEEDINQAERAAKESFNERDALLRSRSAARTELEKAQETEAALNAHIVEADDRERALQTELAELKSAASEPQQKLEAECERLTNLYTEELSQRTEAEALLAEARASLQAAEERHEAHERDSESQEDWEQERQRLCDELEHYRGVLKKVEQDLAAIETKRQASESLLRSQLDEKEVELLRETTLRIQAELSYETAGKELAASKAALATAEENLQLLRQSTEPLQAEIGTVIKAKAV